MGYWHDILEIREPLVIAAATPSSGDAEPEHRVTTEGDGDE
jgi:hypothetical protein